MQHQQQQASHNHDTQHQHAICNNFGNINLTISSNSQSVLSRINSIYEAKPAAIVNNQQSLTLIDDSVSGHRAGSDQTTHAEVTESKTSQVNSSTSSDMDTSSLLEPKTLIGVSSREQVDSRKKKIRTVFTMSQIMKLNDEFERNTYLTSYDRVRLAKELNLTEGQVKVWFQNKRNKNKRNKEFATSVQAAMTKTLAYISQSVGGSHTDQSSSPYMSLFNNQNYYQSAPTIANYMTPTSSDSAGLNQLNLPAATTTIPTSTLSTNTLQNPYQNTFANLFAAWPPAGSQEARDALERYQLLYQTAFNTTNNLNNNQDPNGNPPTN